MQTGSGLHDVDVARAHHGVERDVTDAGEVRVAGQREGDHPPAALRRRGGGEEHAGSVHGHVTLLDDLRRRRRAGALRQEDEEGDADPHRRIGGRGDAGVEGGPELAVGVRHLVHARVVAVDPPDRLGNAKGEPVEEQVAVRVLDALPERPVLGLIVGLRAGLPGERAVRILLDGDDRVREGGSATGVERLRVAQRPEREAVVEAGEDGEGAEEVLGTAAGGDEALRADGRRQGEAGQPGRGRVGGVELEQRHRRREPYQIALRKCIHLRGMEPGAEEAELASRVL